jgi:hypothetical protein
MVFEDSNGTIQGVINPLGAYYTHSWISVSGDFAATQDANGNITSFNGGQSGLTTMADFISDVGGPTIVAKASSAAGTYNFQGLDQNSNFTFSIEKNGQLQFGAGSTRNSMDVALARNSAGVLEINSTSTGQYRDLIVRGLNTNGTNLGINNTSATYPLDVTGAGRFSSYVDASNLVATSTNATSTINGNLALNANSLVAIGTETYLSHISGGGLALTGTNPNFQLANNAAIKFVDTGGTARNILQVDNGNALNIGVAGLTGHIQISPGTGKQVRFLDHSGSRIFTLDEGTRTAAINVADTGAALTAKASGDSVKGLVARANSGTQGANLFEAQDSSSNPLTVITSSGSVGIGTTSPYALLSISNSVSTAANTPLFVIASTTGGTATTTVLSIANTGNMTITGSAATCTLGNGASATSCSSSDQRLKDDITTLDASSSLAAIQQLNPVSFHWNAWMVGNGAATGTQFGFIAQQVAPVFGNLVSEDPNTHYFKLDYQGLFAPMVGAIQALAQKMTGFANSFTTKELTFTRATGDDIVVTHVHAQDLCVGSTCVTEAQFKAMVATANQSVNQSPSSGGSSSSSQSNDASTTTDTTPPVITINGNNPAHINVGDTYNDLGASVTDNVDLNLGIRTYVGETPLEFAAVDTSAPATYHINYVATDSAGNTATSTRTVIIEAVAAPLLAPSDSPSDATTTDVTLSAQ